MDRVTEIKEILSDVLGIGEKIDSITTETFLLGNIPELDSVAVVALILALERKFSISIRDDEISAQTFQTLVTLTNFVEEKITEKDST
jgi:acyl carrier protein